VACSGCRRRGEQASAAIAATLEFLLVEVEHGRAVFQGRPGPAHLNPMGTVHGGWTATLLDSALGCCLHAALSQGRLHAHRSTTCLIFDMRPSGPKAP